MIDWLIDKLSIFPFTVLMFVAILEHFWITGRQLLVNAPTWLMVYQISGYVKINLFPKGYQNHKYDPKNIWKFRRDLIKEEKESVYFSFLFYSNVQKNLLQSGKYNPQSSKCLPIIYTHNLTSLFKKYWEERTNLWPIKEMPLLLCPV